ncbi:Protein RMD5-like protein B [Microtus ochrogaster]|uniref:Protein RMD5-like protein B n=1 Tax=Microtus ochrogaster TaxID=79684 RepID=A0A8J6H2B4_MICOH|nr:Protein RMD5-like protein B [Microtus ochrogaster]
MEQCACVERELDKVLHKFLTYGQHCEQSLEELLHYVGQLRAELASAGARKVISCSGQWLSADTKITAMKAFRVESPT